MRSLFALASRRLTSESQDSSAASKVLYAAGLAVFVLSTLRVSSLRLDEAQLVLAVLVIIGVTMQCLISGLLLEIHSGLKAEEERER